MDKLKIGIYWGAGCGGCDLAVLEIHEKITELLSVADVAFWPCIADFKYADVAAMADTAIDICLFNGAIRNDENMRVARLLRRKSAVLVAFGACSMMGGIPGLGNFCTRESIFERAYCSSESTDNPSGAMPQPITEIGDGKVVTLPKVHPKVKALHQVVHVDYFMPGCPPAEHQVAAVVETIAAGALPAAPAIVGAGSKSVCDECKLEKRGTKVAQFKRPHQLTPDPGWCLLEQGVVCMGPATRSGCDARCMSVAMPCRGCYGPAGNTVDQGAKMIAALGSIIDSEDEDEISRIVDDIVDPAGTFYRFSLPVSLLKRSRDAVPADSTTEQTEALTEPAGTVASEEVAK